MTRTSFARAGFVVGLALAGPAFIACSGDPNLGGTGGTSSSLDGRTGTDPGGPTGSGTGTGTGTGTGSGSGTGSGGTGGGTELVCTPGCEDTPRDTESCADAVACGFCSQDWFGDYCKVSCGSCEGTEEVCVEVPVDTGGGGRDNPGGTVTVTPVPGSSPTGHGTRYWDCCKQHCSWPDRGGAASCGSSNQLLSDENEGSACASGGEKGDAHTCWSMAPWAVADNLAYGFAAVPPGGACGKCYQLDFTGTGYNNANDAGSKSLAGKTMIVQATNIGHDVNGNQFDILIPGGGVGTFNACSEQWDVANNELGAQYGGLLTTCSNSASCLRDRCNDLFSGKGDLLDGCLFLADWMGAADNPNFKYAEVACPAAITQVSGM